jgi:hypothetical protein
MKQQKEIEKEVEILDATGNPINCGWAKKPVFCFNDSLIWTPPKLNTFYDKYIIFSNAFMFVFELCNNGIFGLLNITTLSLLDKHMSSKSVKLFLPLGNFNLPANSENTPTRFHYKNNIVEFITMEQNTRLIKIDIAQIGHNRRLRGEVVLTEPVNAQSIYAHSFWRNESKHFRLIRSSPWWLVEGIMQFENTDMAFIRDKAWGIFYWNRMTRPKRDLHYWAAGCGAQNGKQIGFNLGYGTDDSTFGTENGFFINGILHKLELVTFQFSTTSWMDPWTFTSSNNNLEMNFFPLQKKEQSNFFLFHSDRTQQIFGFFSGRLILDDGSILNFKKITGIVERRRTRN